MTIIDWINQLLIYKKNWSEFTEDELRPIATPNVPVAPGVAENESNTPQRELERRMQGGEVVS